jgi:hypothetical protein
MSQAVNSAAGGAAGAGGARKLSELSKMIEFLAKMLVDVPDQVVVN